MPLKELIGAYGDGRCTDPRDRIYSLLGLCRSGSAGHRLSADYNQSALGLFFETLDVYDAAIPVLLGRRLRAILQLNDDLYGKTAYYLSQAIEEARPGTLDAEMKEVEIEYLGYLLDSRMTVQLKTRKWPFGQDRGHFMYLKSMTQFCRRGYLLDDVSQSFHLKQAIT